MTIRQEIINDIKHLKPELLSNAYDFLENLKQIGSLTSLDNGFVNNAQADIRVNNNLIY